MWLWLLFVSSHALEMRHCSVSSLCQLCLADEMAMPYCAPTGRRVELSCSQASGHVIHFESCEATPQDELMRVMRFEGWMLLLGGISYCIVQRRRLRHQTLYDRRIRAAASSTVAHAGAAAALVGPPCF